MIGASRDPRKFGHIIFKNFIESKFNGKTKAYTELIKTIEEHQILCIKSLERDAE